MHIDAVAPVNGHAIAACDKTDDFVARDRRTAARELNQTVIDTLNDYTGRRTGDTAMRLLRLRLGGVLGQLTLAAQLADVILDLIDDLGQGDAAVADGSVQLIK